MAYCTKLPNAPMPQRPPTDPTMWRRLIHGKSRDSGGTPRITDQVTGSVSDAEIDVLLAEDPDRWTPAELHRVRTKYDRLTRDVTLGAVLGTVPADRLAQIYRYLLRVLTVPVILFVALYVWGHLLPRLVLGAVRVLDELVLGILSIEICLVSRHLRYHQVTVALESRPHLSDDPRHVHEPRRLMGDSTDRGGQRMSEPSARRIFMDPPR